MPKTWASRCRRTGVQGQPGRTSSCSLHLSRTLVQQDLCQRPVRSYMMLHVSRNFVREAGNRRKEAESLAGTRNPAAQGHDSPKASSSHGYVSWNLSLWPGCVASSTLLRKSCRPKWTWPRTNHRKNAFRLQCMRFQQENTCAPFGSRNRIVAFLRFDSFRLRTAGTVLASR